MQSQNYQQGFQGQNAGYPNQTQYWTDLSYNNPLYVRNPMDRPPQPQQAANWNAPTPFPFQGLGNSFQNGQGNQQYQQPQSNNYQQKAQSDLLCRVIASTDDIKPIDISMDGTPSVFVSRDLSNLYVGRWGNEGKIEISQYAIVQKENPQGEIQNQSTLSLQDVMNELDSRFGKLEGLLSSNKVTNNGNGSKQNQKKGVTENA